MQKRIKKHSHGLLGGLIGLAAFLVIFGLEPLRYTGTGWTLYGYDGNDITQHQTGWMFFRNSPWSFPLGNAQYLGYPDGVSISYTDSIPIVAIFFKLISPILPETFQYFGLYTLASFILQGFFAAELIWLFTKNHVYSVVSSILFVFATPLIERSFRHTALSSHWLLLAAMYLYFSRKKNSENKNWFIWEIILCCVSLGIHPYLFAMILAVCIVSEFSSIKNSFAKFTLRCGVLAAICAMFGFCIGVFGENVSPYYGFGEYSLNLNAFINSYSKYHLNWSLFTTPLEIYGGQGDGSYYFGITAFVTLIVMVVLFGLTKIKQSIKKYWEYIVLMVLFLIFSFSNIVTFNSTILFGYNIPGSLYKLCNIFRASGRFCLIPYYSLFLLLCVLIYSNFRKNFVSLIILTFVAVLQIIDITPGLSDIHKYWQTRYSDYELSSVWNEIAAKYDEIKTFDCNGDRTLAYWAAKKGLKTNIMITAPIHQHIYWEQTELQRTQLKDSLTAGKELNKNTVYFISSETGTNRVFSSEDELSGFVNLLMSNYNEQAEIELISNWIKNYWVIMPIQQEPLS